MASDYPLKIFYDASCPVCALEMDQLRARDSAGRLELVDMSAPGFDAACHGFAHADLDAAIHAVRPDGTIVRGMPVLRLAYRRRRPRLARPADRLGPLRPAFDAAYRVFARNRKAISRALAPAIAALRAPARARGRSRVNVLVCGATGCIGRAVARALRWRGHHVVAASRGAVDGSDAMALDFMRERSPAEWSAELRARRIDAIVNCVGILCRRRAPASRGCTPRGRSSSSAAPRSPASAASSRSRRSASAPRPSGRSGLPAQQAPRRRGPARPGRVDAAVVRPSLVFGPGSASAALFATLASLPVIGLPGRPAAPAADPCVRARRDRRRPRRAHRLCARHLRARRREPLDYRRMLESYRRALGLGDAIWLPVPMPLMELGARLAELVPQRVFSRDTLAPARGRQPAVAQRRAGAARPRPERHSTRSGGDAAAAAVRSAVSISPRRSSPAFASRSPFSGSAPRRSAPGCRAHRASSSCWPAAASPAPSGRPRSRRRARST